MGDRSKAEKVRDGERVSRLGRGKGVFDCQGEIDGRGKHLP